ncbi:acyl-CoA thioesterase [Oryzobacter telluris]|uniref:acyl-CoA thioesterase n=1 Tax=Oryzobacter telluris TaxID=3149179 RepID=UPI00370D940F
MTDPRELRREDFDDLSTATTRWSDNDMLGHLNNAVYLELFDTAINAWMVRETGIDERVAPEQGVVAQSTVRYFSEVSFPGTVDVAVRVARTGRTSVVLEAALFLPGSEDVVAHCEWVQVYIGRESRRPTPIPAAALAVFDRCLATRAPRDATS